MGGGASTAKTSTSENVGQHKKRRNSVQDEAHSARSKHHAMKFLLRQEVSRTAFYKFLRSKNANAETFLEFYCEIEKIKKIEDIDQIFSACKSLVSTFAKLSCGKEVIKAMGEILAKSVTADSKLEITHLLNQSQEESLVSLDPFFTEYCESDIYKAWVRQDAIDKVAHQQHQQEVPRRASTSLVVQSFPIILVIDDVPASARYMSILLQRGGFEVTKAESSKVLYYLYSINLTTTCMDTLSLSLSLSVSLPLSLSLSLSRSLSLSLSVCLSVCLSPSLSLPPSLFLSFPEFHALICLFSHYKGCIK